MKRYVSLFLLAVLVTSLAACASSRALQDTRVVRATKGDLSGVKYGLNYFRHLDVWSSYPAAATITSHEDLIDVIGNYVMMRPPEIANWSFVSYIRPRPDWFELRVKAHNKEQTLLRLTRNGVDTIEP